VVQQTFTDFECFIVDNGSSDSSLASLPELDSRFSILDLGENTGFARGNNIAAEEATGEWIALLNPDAFARPDWLETLLEATTLAPHVTMVGSTQFMALEDGILDGLGDEYHAFGLAWRAGFGYPVSEIVTRKTFAPCGAGAFYHAETFKRLGGFDETFFCYHEDVDLAFRMRLDGGICVQSADAIIDHVSSGISGRASDFAVYHGTRNRIWTFVNNMPWPLLILLGPAHLVTNLFVLIWSIFRPGRFKPTFRGMRHGFFKRPKRSLPKHPRKISLITILKSFGWDPIKVLKRKPVKTKSLTQ
jgi:GT2 family glycosyltransferase